MLFIGIYNKEGKLLDDVTRYHTGLEISTADYGYDSASFNVTLDYARRLFYYLYPGILTVKITGEFYARGFIYLLEKVRIYDLWSTADYSKWSILKPEEFVSSRPDSYNIDKDNRLYMAVKGDTDYSVESYGTKVAFINIRRKNSSSRRITTTAFRYTYTATGSALAVLQTRDNSFGSANSWWIASTFGSGIVTTHNPTETNENIHFGFRPQTGIFLGDDGDQFLQVSGLRIGSTISISGNRLYGDEIIRGTLSGVVTNVGFINPTTSLLQSPQIDIIEADYDGVTALDVIKDVIDKSSIYGKWEAVMYNNRALQFKPKGTKNRTWYVDGSELEFEKDVDSIINTVRIKYKRNEIDTYTEEVREQSSIDLYGFASQGVESVDVTASGLAQIAAEAYLTDNAYIKLEASLTACKVKDRSGAMYPPSFVRKGDRIVLQNIPISISLGEEISFICAKTIYTEESNEVEIMPDNPTPTLMLFLNLLKRNTL
jgi:hypothetical protein